MTRERFAWICCTILAAAVALSVGASSSSSSRDDDYAFVRMIVDLQRMVGSNYVKQVDPAKLREAAINGMLSELDPFTVYVPPNRQDDFDRLLEGTFKGVGVQLNQLDNGLIEVVTPVDGSPAFKAGVMAGDVILKVNNESVEGLRLPEAIKKIAGPVGTEVTFTVRHATGEVADLKMTRQDVVIPTIRGFNRLPSGRWDWYIRDEPRIGYLRCTQFTAETFDGLKSAIDEMLSTGMRGLVIDLRFNPGGRLDQAIRMVDLFVDNGVIVSTKGMNRPEQSVRATASGALPRFPIIVVVNGHSASASEIFAGSLQDNKRAVVIGERTYGKGSVQEVVPLSQNAGELKMTVAYYYLPSGRCVHREKDSKQWGVEPNIVVEMDENEQARLQRDRYEAEIFKRPTTKPSTQPTTQPTLDPQLQRAVDTMTALLVFDAATPATQPTQ